MGEFTARAEELGHVLRRDEDGRVDIFAYSVGYCNGPVCEACNTSWCEHCDSPSDIRPCDAGEAYRARCDQNDRDEWARLVAKYGDDGPPDARSLGDGGKA